MDINRSVIKGISGFGPLLAFALGWARRMFQEQTRFTPSAFSRFFPKAGPKIIVQVMRFTCRNKKTIRFRNAIIIRSCLKKCN
jgi:hypothetical protein